MSGAQLTSEPGFPSNSVVVVNPTSWAVRTQELGLLLATVAGWRTSDRVIPDASGRLPEEVVTISDPSYWSSNVAELGDALRDPSTPSISSAGSRLRSGVGAVTESPGRLTWTVEEAAAALGVSRAFAYDAVRRGEIPAIKIGRRILVPRSALRQLLENPTASSQAPSQSPAEGASSQ
jgi:excisionase family DNA binding protein